MLGWLRRTKAHPGKPPTWFEPAAAVYRVWWLALGLRGSRHCGYSEYSMMLSSSYPLFWLRVKLHAMRS